MSETMNDWYTLAGTAGLVFFMVSVYCFLNRIAVAVERMRENSDRAREDMGRIQQTIDSVTTKANHQNRPCIVTGHWNDQFQDRSRY